MSELQILLKTVSVVLKSLADGIETIAGHLEDPEEKKPEKKAGGKSETGPKTKTPEAATKVPSPKNGKSERGEDDGKKRKGKSTAKAVKPPKAKTTARKKKREKTDTEILLELIQNAENGIGQTELAAATGFSTTKIYNIVYRLKNKGQVKAERKGFYEKA